MAYDEDLANRIRELMAGEPGVTEMRMFGGLAFLLGGHMSVAASGRGGLMVRVEPEEAEAPLGEPGGRGVGVGRGGGGGGGGRGGARGGGGRGTGGCGSTPSASARGLSSSHGSAA